MSTDAQAIVDITLAAAAPNELDPDKRYAVVTPDNGVEIIEPQDDHHRVDGPRRLRGTSVVEDVDSLEVLWKKYAVADQSEVFADRQSSKVTAVLNADTNGLVAGFRDHRIELGLRLTPAWKAWAGHDGQLLEQRVFAEFIEDRVEEIVEPTGATMLELAQSFEASVSAQFKQVSQLSGGARALQFEETVAARAGQNGQIEIPATFVVGLAPYEGGPTFRVTARFRYRLRNGTLSIGYKLDRPDEVLRLAFDETVEKVSEAIGQQVLLGTPPAAR